MSMRFLLKSLQYMLLIKPLVLLLLFTLRLVMLTSATWYSCCNKLNTVRNLWYFGIIAFYLQSIHVILISGDIHKNPGPSSFSDGFFNFCHWNLNSIPAHNYSRVAQLEAYNAQLNLDIIALTETALKPSDESEKISIDGYTALRRDLPQDTTHGGVMLFHKDNLALRPREDLENHPNVLVSEITICKKKIFFTVVYRRFGQTSHEFDNFIAKFDELCSSIAAENPFCSIFVGDFNAHLSDWWNGDCDDNFGMALQNIFNSHGLQ